MSLLQELPRQSYPGDAFARFRATPEFDIGTARALVWLVQASYETRHPDKVRDILGGWGLVGHIVEAPTVGAKLARAVVVEGHGASLVAVSGTDVVLARDYLTNLKLRLSDEGLHSGFGSAAAALLAAIRPLLGNRPAVPLVLAGHSLGGAIAVILARALARDGRPPAAVYTYGMPRPGSPAFAEAYDRELGQRTYRLIHGHDPIARVPPIAFAHVGRMLEAPSGGRFEAGLLANEFRPTDPPHLPRTREALWQRIAGVLPPLTQATRRRDAVGRLLGFVPPAFADHFMDRYLEALDRSVGPASAGAAQSSETAG